MLFRIASWDCMGTSSLFIPDITRLRRNLGQNLPQNSPIAKVNKGAVDVAMPLLTDFEYTRKI